MLWTPSLLPRSLLGSRTPIIGKGLGTQDVLELSSLKPNRKVRLTLSSLGAQPSTGISEGLGGRPTSSSPRGMSGSKLRDTGIGRIRKGLEWQF